MKDDLVEAPCQGICCPNGCMVKGTDNLCAAPGFDPQARATLPIARKHFMEEAAGIAEMHREPGEQSEVWFKGWNAACEHLAELFRDIDKPMPQAPDFSAAGEPA